MLKNLNVGAGYILYLAENGKEEIVYTVYRGQDLTKHFFVDAFEIKKGYQFDEHTLDGSTFGVGKRMENATGYIKLNKIQLI